ncbi:MAG: hypothetical protein VR64_14790 [Desulfatitalea sp. BRH_c12]|nr:MAG: hypothetical protein VR64_14790 [Desulfatitalea sp. BRH_c12]
MPDKARAHSALLAVFPTHASYLRFAGSSENAPMLQSLIAFAAATQLIASSAQDCFEAFIRDHAHSAEMCAAPKHLDFEAFFEQKDVLLALRLSARALAERINALLQEYRIELPKVSNAMLTRLKKETADTPHKQNVLRSLAFWLGHERAQLGPQWNFETLLSLCRAGKPQVDHKEGVRIGFALYSRGDVIDHEIVGWLKRELKSYIEQSLARFSYGRWGKVRSHDITTLYVDFPKESKVGNPAAYRHCLRSSLSLAHQMAIRWALSDYCTQNRFLAIGLTAGSFDKLDNHLLPVLNAKLPGDPVIRLTDYARQCVLINDIRALLSSRPAEVTLFNGETLTIWWAVSFWSTLYFDFIPDLLTDPMLQNDALSAQRMSGILWSSIVNDPTAEAQARPNAISTFLRFPQNSLLGLEIAKTLYYRRRFWDAIDILRVVLSLDPTHLNARTLRMVLLRNLAIDAPGYSVAEGMFDQAHLEADFIKHNCAFQSEDFYCEYAVVYLAEAMAILRYLRSSGAGLRSERAAQLKQKVMDCLAHADRLLSTGLMVSPTGIRANYLLNTVKVLAHVLQNDPALFSDVQRSIDGHPDTVHRPIGELQWQLGFVREDLAGQQPYALMENIFRLLTVSHDDSISLQAYRPTTYFCTAVAWWDLFPVRTVAGARRTLRLLQGAADIAATMDKRDICIYSFTRTYGEMIPAGEFIGHMQASMRMVQAQSGGDLQQRDKDEVIQPTDPDRMALLMTLNF